MEKKSRSEVIKMFCLDHSMIDRIDSFHSMMFDPSIESSSNWNRSMMNCSYSNLFDNCLNHNHPELLETRIKKN